MRREIRNSILRGVVAAAYVMLLIEPYFRSLRVQLMDENEYQEEMRKQRIMDYFAYHYPDAAAEVQFCEQHNPFNLLFFLSKITILIHLIYLAIKMVSFLVQLGKTALLDRRNLQYLINYDLESVVTFICNSVFRAVNFGFLIGGSPLILKRQLVDSTNNMLDRPIDLGLLYQQFLAFGTNLDISGLLGISKVLSNEPGFICPITHTLFQAPVISFETGFSYERSALEANRYICPITNKCLLASKIKPNHALRKFIAELRAFKESAFGDAYKSKVLKLVVELFKCVNVQNVSSFEEAVKLLESLPETSNLFECQCPISRDLFREPKVLSDGHSYENGFNPSFSPMTGEKLTGEQVENVDLKRAMQAVADYFKPEKHQSAIVRAALTP